MDDIFTPNYPTEFNCKKCDFKSSNKKDYKRHISTLKHLRITMELHKNETFIPSEIYKCPCGRIYKYRQGLWKHRKICKIQKNPDSVLSDDNCDNGGVKVLTDLVKDVMKQNQDLTNKIIDICKTVQTNNAEQINNTISYNNVHSNNKTFNLQFFLNETCKDAMNISDFVESIKFQIKDLEHVGETDFVEGISVVVLDNLKNLDIQRPIHCSDTKREVIYIKDNNEWIKDDNPNTKMTKVIKQIANKNMKTIPEWVKNNPDCYKSESKNNDKYLKIVSNSMSGGSELEQKTNISKIISRIAKEVTIDKNKYQLK